MIGTTISSQDLTYMIACAGTQLTLVRLVLSRLRDYLRKGTCQTISVCIEGRFGIGKTTLAIFTGLAVVATVACKLFLRKVPSTLDKDFPSKEELVKLKDLCEAAQALYEGDYDKVAEYIRKNIAFGPFELVEKIDGIMKENTYAPFLIVDDAGIFFSRTGWLAYSKVWKEAVVYLVSMLDLMRTFTGAFLMTTPSRKHVLTRLAELMNMRAVVKPLPKRKTISVAGITLVADRGIQYSRRTTTIVAGKLAETYIPLNRELEPFFLVGKKIINKVMESVNEVRRRWIEFVVRKVRHLLEEGKADVEIEAIETSPTEEFAKTVELMFEESSKAETSRSERRSKRMRSKIEEAKLEPEEDYDSEEFTGE